MTAALSKSPEAEALAGMTRSQYLDFKLRQDLKTMAWMFVFFWLVGFESRSLTYLAASYLLILAAARFDYGRKWDRAHAVRPSPDSIRQPGE